MNLPEIKGLGGATIRRPISEQALPLVTNLGPGETEVLMLALLLAFAVLLKMMIIRESVP